MSAEPVCWQPAVDTTRLPTIFGCDILDTKVSEGTAEVLLTRGYHPLGPLAIKYAANTLGPTADDLLREAYVLAHFDDSGKQSPLAYPEFVDYRSGSRSYLAMYRLAGRVLSYREAYRLSDHEKHRLGSGLGAFAVWMADTISGGIYDRIVRDSGPSYDRVKDWRNHQACWLDMDRSTYPAAHAAYAAIRERLRRIAEHPEPAKYIGHDDLRPQNITFEQREGLWVPSGVMDFGLAKPLTPEREFRHLRMIGKTASDAAVEVFEAATGQLVNHDSLDWWARMQVSTALIWGITTRHVETVCNNRPAAEVLFPELDWSELDRFAAA